MRKIIRVFPRLTSFTPADPLAFVGDPPLIRPQADEVHVSCTFTWDIPAARRLAQAWGQYYPVKLGGPSFDDPGNGFTPGMYVKQDVTFTSRGCNNHCPWCLASSREGPLQESEDVAAGHIIQDNNFLQCSPAHRQKVYTMLRAQRRAAIFAGGLEAALVTDAIAEELRSLRIESIFLACDSDAALKPLERALSRLSFLPRDKLRCYVLLAFNGEIIQQAEARLERVWELGAMPFAQVYQPPDHHIEYSQAWRALARTWSRPCAMRVMHRITR